MAETVRTESEETVDEPQWFVIHTYSGYENKVKKNLEHRVNSMDMADKIFRVDDRWAVVSYLRTLQAAAPAPAAAGAAQ